MAALYPNVAGVNVKVIAVLFSVAFVNTTVVGDALSVAAVPFWNTAFGNRAPLKAGSMRSRATQLAIVG